MVSDNNGLDANISAALDEVLEANGGDPTLLRRFRRLIENCLADNYDQTDVLAVIELGVKKCDDGGDGNGA